MFVLTNETTFAPNFSSWNCPKPGTSHDLLHFHCGFSSLFFCSWFSYSATLVCSACSVGRSVCVLPCSAAALVEYRGERRESRYYHAITTAQARENLVFQIILCQKTPTIFRANLIFVMTLLNTQRVNLVLPAGPGRPAVLMVGPAGRSRRLGQTKTAKSVGPHTGLTNKIP